eukprot:2009808-Alexandrium_andersonii.AAC.1
MVARSNCGATPGNCGQLLAPTGRHECHSDGLHARCTRLPATTDDLAAATAACNYNRPQPMVQQQ